MSIIANGTNIKHINCNGTMIGSVAQYVSSTSQAIEWRWADYAGTYQTGTLPTGVASLTASRNQKLEPSTTYGTLSNGAQLNYQDLINFTATASDYWTVSLPNSLVYIKDYTFGTEQTWTGVNISGVTATRIGRSLTVSGSGQGTINVTYTKQTDGTSTTVSKFTITDSATYSAWAGADISWKYSYVSVDRTASTALKTLNKRWTYYPTVYSGTIAKGTDAITIKGPYNTTPTSKSYVTFSEFTSSTSDKTIARLPLVSAGGTRTGTFLTSLSHLFIYKETGIKIIGTYNYGVAGASSFEVNIGSTGTNSFNIVNSSGAIVGTVTFTLGTTIGSGITWVKTNSSTLTSLNVLVTVTDVQVYAFNAANPYSVAVTPANSRMSLTNNETITQYITYKGGTFSTSNADYSWSPATNNCTTLASGSADSWGATDISDSASEDYAIYYGNSDASWETWNSYFNKPNTDYMDNYG